MYIYISYCTHEAIVNNLCVCEATKGLHKYVNTVLYKLSLPLCVFLLSPPHVTTLLSDTNKQTQCQQCPLHNT